MAHDGKRNRGGWTRAGLAYVDRVNQVLANLRTYWPLTLRQVYYQLVAAGDIANKPAEYAKLSRILTKARLDNLVSWDTIEDRARAILHSGGWNDQAGFVQDQVNEFLNGYRRDLLQSQALALEVWIEKDALSRVCHRAAFSYCVPVIVARGFSSISYVHECRKRVARNAARGKRTRILYFGDLDPSGWEMLPAMLETLQVEMKLQDQLEGHRQALTPEQVDAYRLPRNPDALKPSDSRAKKYMRRFGELAVELDALPPAALEGLVRQAIEGSLDKARFAQEVQQENAERARLEGLRSQVQRFIEEAFS